MIQQYREQPNQRVLTSVHLKLVYMLFFLSIYLLSGEHTFMFTSTEKGVHARKAGHFSRAGQGLSRITTPQLKQ